MRKLIYGKNTVLSALKDQKFSSKIKEVYLLKKPQFFIPKEIKVFVKDKKYFSQFSSQNHQGFIALIDEFEYSNLQTIFEDKPRIVVFLDHIEDVHNFGSIIRTTNALGIQHIVIPKKRASQINPTVLKVSSGGFINMKIIRVNSLMDAATKLRKGGFWIYASSLKEAKDINQIAFNFPLILIVGNEGKGVSNSLLKMSDELVKINMNGKVQSLNVSVATGILLFKIINGR